MEVSVKRLRAPKLNEGALQESYPAGVSSRLEQGLTPEIVPTTGREQCTAETKKGTAAPEPVDVSFFGLEGEVPEHTSFSHQTDCMGNVHVWNNEPLATGSQSWEEEGRGCQFFKVDRCAERRITNSV